MSRNKGFNAYFVVIIALLLFTVWFSTLREPHDYYTKTGLTQDLEKGNVTEVTIRPNKETPTGAVYVELKQGSEKTLYVSDVKEIETLLAEYGLEANMENVPQENWFLAYVLPILVVVIIAVFFFVMMNAQNSGGNGGSLVPRSIR